MATSLFWGGRAKFVSLTNYCQLSGYQNAKRCQNTGFKRISLRSYLVFADSWIFGYANYE